MRKLIAIAAAAALFCSPALAAPVYVPGQGGAVGPNVACTNSDGATIRCIQPSVTLNDATGAAIGTSGNPIFTSPTTGTTGDVNVKQVNGATVNVGAGAAGTGTQRVILSSDSPLPSTASTAALQSAVQTPLTPSTASATAGQLQGCNYYGNSGTTFTTNQQGAVACTLKGALFVNELDVNGTAGVNMNGGVKAVGMAPTTSSLAANTPIAGSAVASSLVLKASAGNLYSWRVVAGASAGFVMVFNATSAPGDGAVTPLDCVPVAANGVVSAGPLDIPDRYSTGITIVFSTTGCYSKTASATAYIRGTFQ